MEAVLKFDLPGEKEAFDLANKAEDLYLIIEKLDNHMRHSLKYLPLSHDSFKTVSELREYLQGLLDEHGCYIGMSS